MYLHLERNYSDLQVSTQAAGFVNLVGSLSSSMRSASLSASCAGVVTMSERRALMGKLKKIVGIKVYPLSF